MDFDIAMDPEFRLHRDFRSPSIPKQRRCKTSNKYYSYRAVHPSWVGQSYYTLHLVSSTVHTVRVGPQNSRNRTPHICVTHVTEQDEPALLETLRQDHGWHSFHPLWLESEIHVAVAQAKHVNVESYPIVVSDSGLAASEDPENPRNIERISINPPSAYPPTMPDNLHLKLRVRKWTKKDNYTDATKFWCGPDRRHSRGKRSYRERHLQKWNEKELGRGMRERTTRLKWERTESCRYNYEPRYTKVWDNWMSDCDTTYWDMDSENWLGTGWWDDDGYEADEGEWHGGYHAVEREDEADVIYKVSQWRQLWCDYEGMAEMEGCEVEDDTFSVGSDVVVLEHIVDLDADLDMMSDVAEVLVQEEWDVVPDTSSLSGT